jgi:hypothetical protein
MTITSKAVLAAGLLLLLRATPLCAGSVQVGVLKASDFDEWRCDTSMPPSGNSAPAKCASAKFQGCSPSCDAIVVTNSSDAPVEVELEFSGAGFSADQSGGMFRSGSPDCDGPSGAGTRPSLLFPDSCGKLAPGQRCKQNIEFRPEQSGTSRGQVKVITTASGKPQTTAFELIGDAIYSSELQAADEARRRHLDELKKIPHVADVVIDPKDHNVFIDVEVDEDGSLDKVRRAAPPKIEGYDVEVTRYIEHSVGL